MKEEVLLQNVKADHHTYETYLNDERWKRKRLEIINRDQGKCLCCGAKEHLVVHHRQYWWSKTLDRHVDPWCYPKSNLITLCQECHKNGHAKFKVVTKYID